MSAKYRTLFLLSSIGILVALGQQPCHGMVQKYRKTQDEIMQQAQQQIATEPETTHEITRGVLTDAREKIEQPAGQAASPLRPIKERLDQLLAKKEVKPEEIATLKKALEQVATSQGTGLNRAEYTNLAERLDMAQKFAAAIDRLQKSQVSLVGKLNDNFEAVADTGEKTELRFSASVVANIVMVIGLITRIGSITNAKLERQLKQLQIVEKKAQLKKDGIDLD